MTETGGTYTLLIEFPERAELTVGALGTVTFESGWYAYVGSALGPGGFSRIDRHRELAADEREIRHWHIDYLLGHAASNLADVVTSDGVDGECRVARSLDFEAVPEFGCSDCDCGSHLVYSPDRQPLWEAVETVHRQLTGGHETQ